MRLPILVLGMLAILSNLSGDPSPMNVVLVITDDQGFGDVGFNGNPVVHTPNLDRFASRSVIFNKAYAYPVCSPTRAALMTGRDPYRTGVLETQEGRSTLRPSEITIAESLRGAGYRTGIFGKWHLGDNAPARPQDQGFDRVLVHLAGMIGAPYSPLDAQSYMDPVLIDNGIERRFAGYCTDIFNNAAIDFIQNSVKAPFFACIAYNAPHHPLTVPDSYAQPFRDRGFSEESARYYGMIRNIDANFGRLIETIEALGVMDDTLIIFVGDNGTSSLHAQPDLWEPGLRGRKTHVYENGIRVPLFVHMPASPVNGSRFDTRVVVQDIMPTILEICGVTADVAFDGVSWLPLLKGEETKLPERPLVFQFHRGQKPVRYRNSAVIEGDYKLVQPVGRGAEPFSQNAVRFELYNLADDPNEKEDLAALEPDVVQKLKALYDAWYDSVCAGGFEPVRTWIGSEVGEKVTLTRQDWIGGGLFDGDFGHYLLDIKQAGAYTVVCRWSDLLGEAHPVVLKINGKTYRNQILYAESECRFEAVNLPIGPCRLEAWVEIEGKACGFRFVELELNTIQSFASIVK